MARFPLLLLVAIAALMHADRLAVWLSLVFVGATIVLVVLRVIQARQQMRHRGAWLGQPGRRPPRPSSPPPAHRPVTTSATSRCKTQAGPRCPRLQPWALRPAS